MSLSATAILTAIAALTPSGITEIYTFDDAPIDMTRAKLPALAPDIDNWQANNQVEQEGGETFGGASERYWHVNRGLGFILYLAQVGANRNNPYTNAKQVSAALDSLIEALLELNVSGVDVLGVSSGKQEIITDLTEHSFHACRIGVNVREDINP